MGQHTRAPLLSASLITIGRDLVLGDQHLAVATGLVANQLLVDDQASAVADLEAVGLLRDGILAPRLHELAAVVAAPTLKICLEVLGPWGIEVDFIWLSPELVVAATAAAGSLRLAPLEPAFLIADIARRVGLRRHQALRPAPEGTIRVASALLAELEAIMAQSDRATPAALAQMLDDHGVDEPWHSVLVDVVAHRSLSWRVKSEWVESGLEQNRLLSMLDGGVAGLFQVNSVSGRSDDETIELIPMSASEALRRIRSCLPQAPGAVQASVTL